MEYFVNCKNVPNCVEDEWGVDVELNVGDIVSLEDDDGNEIEVRVTLRRYCQLVRQWNFDAELLVQPQP